MRCSRCRWIFSFMAMKAAAASRTSRAPWGLNEDMSPPPVPKGEAVPDAIPALRDAGSGRPTKKERRETDRLASLHTRPVLASPEGMVTVRAEEIERLLRRSSAAVSSTVVRAADQLVHLQAQVRALSPQKTLDRGYAVVELADGRRIGVAVFLRPGRPSLR